MKKNVTVLGCGLVGATMARDLAGDDALDVSVVDVSGANLGRVADTPRLRTRQADLGGAGSVAEAIRSADVVVGAMPSALGLMALRTVIECRKPYADISFMAEDATQLDGLARQAGVTAVVDCGVAPGLANMMIGRSAASLRRVDQVVYYVGGLPKRRTWPYQYKAPFAPLDVVEEYTRPARLKVNGTIVSRPALSEPELLDFEEVGTLEAFNTDGLRSLLTTIDAPNMKEKTLRWPGHAELMRVLRETGYFGKEEIALRSGVRVRPLDVTSALLFRHWEPAPRESEFTILRVIVGGSDDRGAVEHRYDLYDENDAATGYSSMARTTGFPCAIVARLLARGEFDRPGVHPPETLGREPRLFDHVMGELESRGVSVRRRDRRSADGPE